MKIGVVGCGNVGFAFLSWLKKQGHVVFGFDCASEVRKRIRINIGENIAVDNIGALSICDCIFICVPTEPAEDTSADLSIYESVIIELSKILQSPSNKSVIQRSTCPPGSANYFASLLPANVSYGVNPSFLRKASIVEDTEAPDRIAYAGDEFVLQQLGKIYEQIKAPRFITDNMSSVELLKYIENTMDSMLISYWNLMLEYASHVGISSDDFIAILEKIGDRQKFQTVSRVPGKAFGLWCLPKDALALRFELRRKGICSSLLDGIIQVNKHMESLVGVGNTPADHLWRPTSDTTFTILEAGKKQIENYYTYVLEE